MRGGDGSDGFSKWGDELPSPEELMPLSQTLITPDLALAFSIGSPRSPQLPLQPPPQSAAHSSQHNFSAEFESPEFCAGGGVSGGDEPARTLKRPRLVWTPQLHKRFVDAVAHLGIKNAVPKTIMQLMSVDGLTRENVASHLQKYRLYLKRMQGISSGGHAPDPVTDHLFASSPVPPHFLHPGQPTTPSDHFMPFVPMPAAMHHHQMQHQFRHFGGSPTNGNGHLELPFMRQPPQSPTISMPPPVHRSNSGAPRGYTGDLDPADGRKVLTLFPTGDD